MKRMYGKEKPEGSGTWVILPAALIILFFLLPFGKMDNVQAKAIPVDTHSIVHQETNPTSFLIN